MLPVGNRGRDRVQAQPWRSESGVGVEDGGGLYLARRFLLQRVRHDHLNGIVTGDRLTIRPVPLPPRIRDGTSRGKHSGLVMCMCEVQCLPTYR